MASLPDTTNNIEALAMEFFHSEDTDDDQSFLSFEMTTPREGEDYSTWTLMAAAAASACQGRMELLENEDGLIFQDLLNGRRLTPQHALGLFECGAGLTSHHPDGSPTEVEGQLCHRALGARLILSTKCLDVGDVLSREPEKYSKLWDLLLPRTFQSVRHAHFAIWILTEVAQREQQGAEIVRLFKDDPTLIAEDILVTGFSREVFRRRAWTYMLEWLLEYPSAHDVCRLLLCFEIHKMRDTAGGVVGSGDQQAQKDQASASSPRVDGKWIIEQLFHHGLGASHLMSLLFSLFEICPDILANTLGSHLCLDLFGEWGSVLASRTCTELAHAVAQGNAGPGAFEGAQLLIHLVRQLDGGCVADKWQDSTTTRTSEEEEHAECMACSSPLIKTLCENIDHINIIQTCLTCTTLPTSLKIQTIDLTASLLRLECTTVDSAVVAHGLVGSMLEIALAETPSPILLSRSITMLMSCLLDKHPETGELLSYRRATTSRRKETVRAEMLELMPIKLVRRIEEYQQMGISKGGGRLMTGKERDIVGRMQAHLTRTCNVLQIVERQEKRLNRTILSESKMDLHSKPAVENNDCMQPGKKLLLNNQVWRQFQDTLREQNFSIFGRKCGAWILQDDDDDDDDDDNESNPPSSPSTSPRRSPPGPLIGSSASDAASILPSTPARTLVAHDVVEYVMAASLASLGQAARERKEQENEELRRPAPLTKSAATLDRTNRMARAEERFGSKVRDNRNRNNNKEDHDEEETNDDNDVEGKMSLVSGMVGRMSLPSSFDDNSDDSDGSDDANEQDDADVTNIGDTSGVLEESKFSLLSVKMSNHNQEEDDEMYGQKQFLRK